MSAAVRQKKSRAIIRKLSSHSWYKRAHSIMFFASKNDEPDIMPLVRGELKKNSRRRKIYLPRVVDKDIKIGCIKGDINKKVVKGKFGILEPINFCDKVDKNNFPSLVIVPARACDIRCYRLGRGLGYYDRFLKELPPDTRKIGIVFDECLFNEIPVGRKDVKLDAVISDKRIIES